MSLKIISPFDKTHPDFIGRTRYMHIGGGLGDIFNHLHMCPCYPDLETLGPSEKAFVLVSSHNSCAWEIFAWHRNVDRITVANMGLINFFYSEKPADIEKKRDFGAPVDCDHRWPIPGPTIYYPSPSDLEALAEVPREKYVVFALTASDHGRSIPKEVGERAYKICEKAGYRVILSGRNYLFNDHEVKKSRRAEIKLDASGVLDYVDRLSVPGTCRLVEGAAAVFTCHSAICMLSWHLRRPTFVIYNEFAKTTYFTNKFEGYSFGAGFHGNGHAALGDYTDEMFVRFINGISEGESR